MSAQNQEVNIDPSLHAIAEEENAIVKQETLDLIAGIANHEAKALLLVFLDQQPQYYGRYAMGKGFNDFIGPGNPWPKAPAGAFQYCSDSLEPIGQVVEGEVETIRGISNGYAISPYGREVGLPLAGLLLDWSLRHPDISLQQILGPTNTRGETRAPQNRLQTLAELLSTDKPSPSIADLTTIDPKTWRELDYHRKLSNVSHAVGGLSRAGLVRLEQVNDANTRRYTVINPNIPENFASRGIYAEAIYTYVQKLHGLGIDDFSAKECLDFCLQWFAHKPETSDIDPAKIRREITQRLGTRREVFPGIQRQELYNEGNLTKVVLNEEYRDALDDLLNIVLAIDEGRPDTVEEGKRLARELAEDNTLKVAIMAKAQQFSPAANKLPAERITKQIVSILDAAGVALDTASITGEYETRFGRNLSRATVQSMLRLLIEQGVARLDTKRSNETIQKRRNFYSLIED